MKPKITNTDRWVYDIIRNPKTNKIVATCIHTIDIGASDCCGGYKEFDLVAEGLTVQLSQIFNSKEDAMADVNKLRDAFSADLD